MYLCIPGNCTEDGRQHWDQKFAYVHEQIQQTSERYYENRFGLDSCSKSKEKVFVCILDHANGLATCLQTKSEEETHDPSFMLTVLESWITGVWPWIQQNLPNPLSLFELAWIVAQYSTCNRQSGNVILKTAKHCQVCSLSTAVQISPLRIQLLKAPTFL